MRFGMAQSLCHFSILASAAIMAQIVVALNVPVWYKMSMKLAQWLTANKLKPSAFAKQVGVSHTTILRYLAGDRFPRRDTAERITAATDGAVTAGDFQGEARAA